MSDKKEELSSHVENIFKQYVHPGLYICDLATGGGKSYTIGKLTCEFYPKHFVRIIILFRTSLLRVSTVRLRSSLIRKGGLRVMRSLL